MEGLQGFAPPWNAMEPDAQVLTQILQKIGIKGAMVQQLWYSERNFLNNLRPIHGIILFQKFITNKYAPIVDNYLHRVYFSKQIIFNACMTQALVTLLLNCNHPDIDMGLGLRQFQEYAMSFDPTIHGLLISNSILFRKAHNSSSQQLSSEPQSLMSSEAYYFIIYVPVHGHVYELNGLRNGPVDLGKVPAGKDWFSVVCPTLLKIATKYHKNQVIFNVMALVSDKVMIYQRQLKQILTNTPKLNVQSAAVQRKVSKLRLLINNEELEMLKYHWNTMRMKRNYMPFINAYKTVILQYSGNTAFAVKKGQKDSLSAPVGGMSISQTTQIFN